MAGRNPGAHAPASDPGVPTAMNPSPRAPSANPTAAAETRQDEVVVRLAPELMEALDRFIEEDRRGTTRADALSAAFRDWAEDKGYLAPSTD